MPYGGSNRPTPGREAGGAEGASAKYLGGAAVVRPGAPGGGVGLADGVGEVLEARSGSRDHVLEELEHFALLPRRVPPRFSG